MNPAFLRNLDGTIGAFLYFTATALNAFSKQKDRNRGKILAIRLWSLGESILILPALKELSRHGKLSVLCTNNNKNIFEGLNFINEIYVLDYKNPLNVFRMIRAIRSNKFDVSADFEPFTYITAFLGWASGAPIRVGYENRPQLYSHVVRIEEDKHVVHNFMNIVRALFFVRDPEKLVPIHVSKNDKDFAKNLVNGERPIVGFHPGSSATSQSRRWPKERFVELVAYLKKYTTVFAFGNSDDAELCNYIASKTGVKNLCGKLTLKQFAAAVQDLDVFIANDSGPMHIAAAMGTPTLGLFGPNSPQRYGPYGPKCRAIYKEIGNPCIYPFRKIFPNCKHNHMDKISVSDVKNLVNEMIRRGNKSGY